MDKTGKIFLIGLGILVVAGGWFIVGSDNKTETGPIKIGASLPLTGEAASYGEQMRPGIELAVEEINKAGGIRGRTVEVVFEDDKCAPNEGTTVFKKLTEIDRVSAVIGPVCSTAAGAGLPVAQKNSVPTIIIASAPGLTKLGDYIFRIYPSDSLQGKYAAEYAYNTLNVRKVSILYVNNEWGNGLKEEFSKKFTELGGTILDTEGVQQDATDLRTVLTKMREGNPDLLYIPLHTAPGAAVAKQAKTLGITVPLLGGDYFDAKEFTSVPEAAGVLFTFGKFNNPDAFKAKIKEVTGADSGILTPLGYDALKILAYVIDRAGTESGAMKDALAKLSYVGGESQPLISFDEAGDLKMAQFEVRVVKNGVSEPFER